MGIFTDNPKIMEWYRRWVDKQLPSLNDEINVAFERRMEILKEQEEQMICPICKTTYNRNDCLKYRNDDSIPCTFCDFDATQHEPTIYSIMYKLNHEVNPGSDYTYKEIYDVVHNSVEEHGGVERRAVSNYYKLMQDRNKEVIQDDTNPKHASRASDQQPADSTKETV